MTAPQAAPQLMQAPQPGRSATRLGLDLVDYDESGEIRFAGTAPSGGTVRVYVDNTFIGDATAAADGRWTLAPRTPVPAGDHRLRLDQVDPAGKVASRVDVPFQRAAVVTMPAGTGQVVVQPQQNLWRIARRAYGQGVRYTEIFAANRDRISDPNRIYPGQVFALPGPATGQGASIPTSASMSR